jgi:hypothetical protein
MFAAMLLFNLFELRPNELSDSIEILKSSALVILARSEILSSELDRLNENLEKLSNENERQKKLLEERKVSLEKWLARLKQVKMRLAISVEKLEKSLRLQKELKSEFDSYRTEAENTIRMYRIGSTILIIGLAIGAAVLIL